MFNPKDYPHTMKPFPHQEEELTRWNKPYHLFAHEQGLGKMKMGYDWALSLWQAGYINTFIVLAPNGVHRDWISEGFDPFPGKPPLVPKEWWPHIDYAYYDGGKAGTKKHQAAMKELFLSKKMVVLAMTYDSAKTKPNKSSGWMGGTNFLAKMLKYRKVAFMADESSLIQNPSAAITKTLVGTGGRGGLAKMAVATRIAEGTPVDEGPLNAYSQFQFLDQNFWKNHGIGSFRSFKGQFAVIQKGFNSATGREFDQIVAWKNLEQLKEIIAPHTTRILKKDALNLPPKIYQPLRFEMSKEQWQLYRKLEQELFLIIKREGSDVESVLTAELPIVNLLKLYQITCGYLPFMEDDNGEPQEVVLTFKENPRLETALEHLRKQSGKVLIWCRFRRDIDLLISSLGKGAVRYDGTLSTDDREKNKREWLAGDAQYLIPQIQAMARGHTLNIAEEVLYYSNSSQLRLRRQSEDRTHRGAMTHTVTYRDMMATDTVDEHRVKRLREKLIVAETIMGDNNS